MTLRDIGKDLGVTLLKLDDYTHEPGFVLNFNLHVGFFWTIRPSPPSGHHHDSTLPVTVTPAGGAFIVLRGRKIMKPLHGASCGGNTCGGCFTTAHDRHR